MDIAEIKRNMQMSSMAPAQGLIGQTQVPSNVQIPPIVTAPQPPSGNITRSSLQDALVPFNNTPKLIPRKSKRKKIKGKRKSKKK